jgi:hypothetical protein
VRQIEVDALRKLQMQLQDDRPSRFFRDKRKPARAANSGIVPPPQPGEHRAAS